MKFFELADCLQPVVGKSLARAPYLRELISMFTTVSETEWNTRADPSALPSDATLEAMASRDTSFTKKFANAITSRWGIENFVDRLDDLQLPTKRLIADNIAKYGEQIDLEYFAEDVAQLMVEIVHEKARTDRGKDEVLRKIAVQGARSRYEKLIIARSRGCAFCGAPLSVTSHESQQDSYQIVFLDTDGTDFTPNDFAALCKTCGEKYSLNHTPEDIEARYPKRDLPEGAKVTRMGPSPTGFMHLGNLYGALVDERLAHQSKGVFYLRIEDTDRKREVEGGVQMIIDAFQSFGLPFDEGATTDGETGIYGPYRQSQRAEIYQTFVKSLVERGMAYPCFCTEEELAEAHRQQEENKENFGYYGKYAVWRDRPMEDIEAELAKGTPYVVRFRSEGSIEHKIRHEDLVKGKMEVTENDQDVVILKSDGIPTYHFAHVVDDHLMGTTIVVRGEEWLATLPVHLQLFRAMGWKAPKYAHTAQLMKIDPETGGKRKLSKRKDPELALTFYAQEGYPVPAVLEYLMTLLNSNFEEWRRANPDLPMNDFPFTTKKMSGSGALFDIEKLRDVSKNVISRMTAEQVYDYVAEWSAINDKEFNALLTRDPAFSKAYLAIGRGGKKPRKDLALWSDAKGYMDFMFDELFRPDYTMPERVSAEDAKAILADFAGMFDENDTPDGFFNKMKQIASAHGYAADTKAYKADPSAFKGAVGDVSMVVRVAVAGRQNAPDLQTVMGILGREKVLDRLEKCSAAL